MSTPTTLNNVLKGATEVTHLESTDRILALANDGTPKKITRLQVATPSLSASNMSSPQWIRIASFSAGAALISINTGWNNNPGIRLLVDMILHSNSESYNSITVLSRLFNAGTTVIPKLRVVRKSGALCYLDIYYNSSKANSFGVHLIDSYNNFNMLPEMVLDAQIPDGYTAKEFDLSAASWGGVNRYITTVYNSAKKGGAHELAGYYELQPYQVISPGCDDEKNMVHGFRCLPYSRNPLHKGGCDESSERSLPLRYSVCRLRRLLVQPVVQAKPQSKALLPSRYRVKLGALVRLYRRSGELSIGKEVAA